MLCTRLHIDHAGWGTAWTDGAWVPSFPHARHLFARLEFAHAESAQGHCTSELFADSVRPLVDAGSADPPRPTSRSRPRSG